MPLPFTLLATLDKNDAITLVRGVNGEGAAIYAYMRMDKAQAKAFERAIEAAKPIDFDEYGEVLASGVGEPDAEIHAELKKEHGFQ